MKRRVMADGLENISEASYRPEVVSLPFSHTTFTFLMHIFEHYIESIFHSFISACFSIILIEE